MHCGLTATPAPVTVDLFGEAFDTYSEAEAIAEGYIVDVAASIISYKTLYNLHCPVVPKADEEKLYPAGVVAKALKNVAFQDDGLIQYKAEVMLRIFEADVMPFPPYECYQSNSAAACRLRASMRPNSRCDPSPQSRPRASQQGVEMVLTWSWSL